jgi:DNA-binding MarR family transcriptional regulator
MKSRASEGTRAGRSRRTPPGNGRATAEDGEGCPAKTPLLGPPFQAVGFAVSSIGYATSRRFRETLAPLDLEPREFAILRGVGASEGISQQAAAERLQIPPSRMVAFVDMLESRGLMARKRRPEDRRAWALHLTPAGRRLLSRALELAGALEAELCADLSAQERRRLLDMLWRIGGRLGIAPGTHAGHGHLGLADPEHA